MKTTTLTFIIVLIAKVVTAQSAEPCVGHPLFTAMPGHSIRQCDEKDFDALEIYQKDAAQGRIVVIKQGHKNAVQFKFDGDWAKRPSPLQITQNYANAIKKAGGEIIYQSESQLCGKIAKGDDTYWVSVYSDGSGDYNVSSVKEEKMKQDVVMTAEEIKGTIKDEGHAVFYGIYFDTDKAALKPESNAALTEIAKFLKQNPAVQVFMVGHTDNTGDFAHNVQLSKERAQAVVSELVNRHGVKATQLKGEGVGPLAPVATNATEEGKAKNRRVELTVR
jgi:outer membrane protein OmpA-like peptidoglycan-associated protein